MSRPGGLHVFDSIMGEGIGAPRTDSRTNLRHGATTDQQLLRENLALKRSNQLLVEARRERQRVVAKMLDEIMQREKPGSQEAKKSQLARLLLAAISPEQQTKTGEEQVDRGVRAEQPQIVHVGQSHGGQSGADGRTDQWNPRVLREISGKKTEDGEDSYELEARKAIGGARRSLGGRRASSVKSSKSMSRTSNEVAGHLGRCSSEYDEKKALEAEIGRPSSSDMGSLAASLLGSVDRFRPERDARFVLYSPSAGIFQAEELNGIRDQELNLSDIIEASSKNISLERLRSDRSEALWDSESDLLHMGKHEPARAYVPGSGCFWLDVTDPTLDEMTSLARVFDIHPLTVEDILAEEETRDKFEEFPDYHFLMYRTIDFGSDNPSTYEFNRGADGIATACYSMVVKKSCILTFHGARNLDHLGNVIDRLRSLADPQAHQIPPLTSAYIAYALIDDITDTLVPSMRGVELEVDTVDELVLILSQNEQSDMLQRIGAARRRILALWRLLQGKPEVVRGFAKLMERQAQVDELASIEETDEVGHFEGQRDPASLIVSPVSTLNRNAYSAVNVRATGQRRDARWGLAPSQSFVMPSGAQCDQKASEQPAGAMVTADDIAHYLADVYDHLVALVNSTGHCDMVLSRAHSNYLARLSLEIGESTVETSIIASRWTVIGAIMVPLNIVTGLWGQNVKVPFGDDKTLRPFFVIVACCLAFVVFVVGVARWRKVL
ncbi:CorA metal ion transporter [Linderina macrospora]|uniref:CorA metal ion transporter n=1 Tax=Linderina macrospora TaxID=4868 RepID=A0ACC1JDT2_9FUNG|nr:CorA metal ion transporter [Linderina macrospora]